MAAPLPDWAPTAEQVAAAYLPQRFHGTVPDDDTVPTRSQMQYAIASRTAEVRVRCGRIDATNDETILAYATDTVALGVASYCEATFWPEQSGEAAMFLRRRYEEHVDQLRRDVLYHWRAHRD